MSSHPPAAAALALCAAGFAAVAQQGPPHAPPAEAYTACTSKAQGDACSVQMRNNQVTGTCLSDPAQKLFCAPPRALRGPPPEALSACASKTAGDACSVTFPDGSLRSGTCAPGPDQSVACTPKEAPRER